MFLLELRLVPFDRHSANSNSDPVLVFLGFFRRGRGRHRLALAGSRNIPLKGKVTNSSAKGERHRESCCLEPGMPPS